MNKEKCPCCGCPTLGARGDYEICLLCDWEDDGQDSDQASEVWGGPNGDYSLEEARSNFKRNMVMYRDYTDNNFTENIELKKRLMKAYDKLDVDHRMSIPEKWSEIIFLEKELGISE